jgi:hypothetical protein
MASSVPLLACRRHMKFGTASKSLLCQSSRRPQISVKAASREHDVEVIGGLAFEARHFAGTQKLSRIAECWEKGSTGRRVDEAESQPFIAIAHLRAQRPQCLADVVSTLVPQRDWFGTRNHGNGGRNQAASRLARRAWE